MTQEALKLALVALDVVKLHYTQNRHVNEAITAIKEALAQEQEPVTYLTPWSQALESEWVEKDEEKNT